MTKASLTFKNKTVSVTVVSIDLARVKTSLETTSYLAISGVDTALRFECEGRSAEFVFDAMVMRNGFSISHVVTRRWNALADMLAQVVGAPVVIDCDLPADDGDAVMRIVDDISQMVSGSDARTVAPVVALEDVEPAALEQRFQTNLDAAQKAIGNGIEEDEDDWLGMCFLDEQGDVGFVVLKKDLAVGTIVVEFHDAAVEEPVQRAVAADPAELAADPMRFVREAYATL